MPGTPAASHFATAATGHPAAQPALTEQQAAAKVAMAQANLAAVNAATSDLPAHMRPQGDAAKAQAEAELMTAKANQAALAEASASAALKRRSGSVGAGDADEEGKEGDDKALSMSQVSHAPTTEQRLARYSLTDAAKRRRRQLGGIVISPSLAFADSSIIGGEQAMNLYLSLPYATGGGEVEGMPAGGEPRLPVTQLIASLPHINGATMESFVQRFQGLQTPTVVLVRANGNVFGGYAADAWDFSGRFTGTPRCFLFSVTKDVRIPYHGRVKGPPQEGDDEAAKLHEQQQQYEIDNAIFMEKMARVHSMNGDILPNGTLVGPEGEPMEYDFSDIDARPRPRIKPWVRHDCQRSDASSIQFGLSDLVIAGDLSACRSQLESSYGIGLDPAGQDAKTLLAGSPVFSADVVEVWSVQ
jgi:hypothetical protein